MTQLWPVSIHLTTDNQSAPLYVQVEDEIIRLISSGILKPGEAIPSSRELAKQLSVSRKTIVTAMNHLTFKGILENRDRVGLFVAKQNTNEVLDSSESSYEPKGVPILEVDDGCPDSMLLPFKEFSRGYRQFFIRAAQFHNLGYRKAKGYERFRSHVSSVLAHSRNLNVTADEICITRGAQMALYLVANAVLNHGDTIAIEHPGYQGAEQVFINAGLNVVHIDVDNQGISTEQLESACKIHYIKAVYVTPRHQYPTTVPMSLSRRKHIAELAEEYKFIVVEDDFGCDFHYSGRKLPPLSCALSHDHFIYIGSFSKIFAPAVRVGYIAASNEIVQKATDLRALIDIQGDNIVERTLSDMIEEGILLRHLKKSIKIYKDKLSYISQKISEELDGKVIYKKPSGGLAVWVVLKTHKSLSEITGQLQERGISIPAFVDSDNHVGLRIGYASLSLGEIDRVINVISGLEL